MNNQLVKTRGPAGRTILSTVAVMLRYWLFGLAVTAFAIFATDSAARGLWGGLGLIYGAPLFLLGDLAGLSSKATIERIYITLFVFGGFFYGGIALGFSALLRKVASNHS